tara:strand:- start:43 stop:483 length:441 start_codon:yes stop_codon:yes gene_type:complete
MRAASVSLFGLLIVATELKSWPIIGAFQKRVDLYFHLLSVPRGKGGFYLFIGLLTFCDSDWGVARVCVLVLAIVGLLHLAGCPRDSRAQGMAASDNTQQHHEPMEAAASASISSFALKVRHAPTHPPCACKKCPSPGLAHLPWCAR